ncbi:MAG: hypothetical protein ACK5LT_13955 [Lachnospirales bacterium]
MKTIKILIISLSYSLFNLSFFVYGITESDVQAVVDSSGKETVTGNLFIWFVCALAFLKISQKIDSYMSSLGINVGHTGNEISLMGVAGTVLAATRLINNKI